MQILVVCNDNAKAPKESARTENRCCCTHHVALVGVGTHGTTLVLQREQRN